MSSLDIVCPYIHRDHDRFLILWKSLEKFLKVDDFRLFLVSPNGSKPVDSPKIIALKETDVSPKLGNDKFNFFGWWRQQIIKLESHRFCDTECILVVDCDCFLNKNLLLKDLIHKKKLKINLTDQGSWDNWYNGSSVVLKLPYNYKKEKRRIKVTPMVLSRSILKGLGIYLNALYNNNYIDPLLFNTKKSNGSKWYKHSEDTWSEYCLYHTYADYTRLIDQYHHIDNNFNLYGNSVWNPQQVEAWDPEMSFDRPNHFFTVFQSVADQSSEFVYNKIKEYLQ